MRSNSKNGGERVHLLLSAILLATLLSALSAPAAAANDPGHDTLYVLKLGDSNVTGSINVSQNLTANYLAATVKLIGTYLDIWANGSTYTPSSRPAIQSTSSNLYIDPNSGGNLYLSTLGGTTNIVQVGPTSGSSIAFNVSGTIYQSGTKVCLANGTNCVAGNNTGNVSSVAESGTSPLTISPTTGNVLISMSQAGSGSDGWLSSTNWNTFNNKAATGASSACTYGIANITLSASGVPTVTCAAAQGTGSGTVNTGAANKLAYYPGAGTTVDDLTGSVNGAIYYDASGNVQSGTLPFASGGTGLSTASDDTVMVSSGSAWVAKAIPDCTTGKLLYTASTNTFSCGTDANSGGTMSSFNAGGDSGTIQTITDGNTLNISGGTGITTTASATDKVSVALTGQALALHNLASNGLIARTGSGTVAARTITGGTGITITNGDGASGNPSIAINNTGVTAASYGDATHVSAITIDAQGRITTASSTAIQTGSTSQTGILQLTDSTSSTSTTTAATPNSVKTTYDLANGKAGTGTATCAAGTVAQNVTTTTGAPTVQCVPVGTGNGSVTSVGLSLPGEFTISGSPVTGSGTLTGTWATQTTNKVLAAPSGSTGTPSFRALTDADIPDTITATNYVRKSTWTDINDYPTACTAGQYITAIGDTLTCSTPSGAGNTTGSGNTNTLAYWTNSTNLGSMGAGTTTTLLHGNAAGTPTWAAVNLAADVTGTLPASSVGNGLTDAQVNDAITVNGGTIGSNTISSGATWTTAGTLTIGDGGDRIDIASNTWDVTNGVITGATYQGNAIADTYISSAATWNAKAGTGTGTCAAGTVAQNVTTTTGAPTVQCIPVGTGSVTSVGVSRTGTTAVTITGSPVTGAGTINLAFQNATTAQDGLLTSTDWTTFNNKAATGASSACTYGIANVTLNSAGVPTVTCAAQQGTGTMSSFNAGGDSGTIQTITDGNTLNISGGTGITTTASATDKVSIALTGQALALHNLASNGLIARTGSGTVAARTIAGGTGITITNGDGVSGNPTIAINNTGVTAASYGTSTQVPTIAIDAQGRITSASNTNIRAGTTAVTGILQLTDSTSSTSTTTAATPNSVKTAYDLANGKAGTGTGTCAAGTVAQNVTTTTGAPTIQCVAVGTGNGSVTSVALSLPGEFTISGSPVTGSGTLTGAWASATQNYVLAAPSGSSGTPSFRALTDADIPDTITATNYVRKSTWTDINDYPTACTAGQYVTAIGDTLTCSTPSGAGNVSGAGNANTLAYWATTSTLSNLGAGTTTTLLHGNAAGTPTWAAVNLAADVTGTLPASSVGNGLTDAQVNDAITVNGGTIGSNTISSGATWTTAGTLTIGDGGDRIDIASNTWDVTNGVITGATYQGNAIADTYISSASTWNAKAGTGTGTCAAGTVAQNVTTTTGAPTIQCIAVGTGNGSVMSISQGTGLSFSANPITTTGTIGIANGGVGATQLATTISLGGGQSISYGSGTISANALAAGTYAGVNIGGNAGTATALAANGANCAAGTYPLGVDASGAVESCGSNINGNAATATYAPSSSKLYSTDAAYNYSSGTPYYGYLTYDGSRWLFQVSPGTPAAVRVAYADNAGQLNGQAASYYLDTSATAQTKTGNLQAATITASTQFSGPGTGLTGTASSLTAGAIVSQGALATLGAVGGGTGGTITDNTITAADLASGDFSSKITSGTYSIAISGNAATATNVAWSGVTSKPTTVSGFGITDFVSSNSGSPQDANTVTTNGLYYANANVGLFGQGDGALYAQAYSSSWIGEIYQDYRTGQIALRGKNSGTWQGWRTVLDSGNYNSYAPTLTGTGASGTWGIGISGNAATATNVAWSGVTSQPAFAANANAGRVRMYEVGCGGSWGSSCDANTNGYPDYTDSAGSITSQGALATLGAVSGGTGGTITDNTITAADLASGDFSSKITSGTYSIGISGNAATATNVAWSGVTGQPSYLFYYQGFTLDANAMGPNAAGFTYSVNAPYTGPIASFSEGGYPLQLNAPYGGGGGGLAFRTRNGDTASWNSWYTVLHSGNYNSYAPTLTGTGASGTWGISVSGNAATATTASTANAVSFNNGLTTGAAVTFDRLNVGSSSYTNQAGDIGTARDGAPTTGVIYLGNSGSKYLYFDGSNYNMPGGNLYVNGVQAVTNSGTWGISVSGNAATASNLAAGTYNYGSGGTIVNSNNANYATNSGTLNGQAASYYLDTSATGQTKSGTLTVGKLIANGGASSNWADINAPSYAAGTSIYSYGSICAGNGGGGCSSSGGVTLTGGTMIGTPSVGIAGSGYSFFNGGNVGIGTATPRTALEISGDGSLLATGTYGSGWTEPNLGAGTRMLWYPRKAAFRAGSVIGSYWDDAYIGIYSTAFGFDTIASGQSSTAMGFNSIASGQSSTAMGASTASGTYSTAMGFSTTASAYESVAIGQYNVGGGTASSWVSTDPLFEVGNGANSGAPANAFAVLKNGKGFFSGTLSVAGTNDQGQVDFAIGSNMVQNSSKMAMVVGPEMAFLTFSNLTHKFSISTYTDNGTGSLIGFWDTLTAEQGRVGIGLDPDPANGNHYLTVRNSITTSELDLSNAFGGTTAITTYDQNGPTDAKMAIMNAVNGEIGWYIVNDAWTTPHTFFSMKRSGNSITSVNLAEGGGNVGIGTNAPNSTLSVGTTRDTTYNYVQIDTLNANTAGPPPTTDCNTAAYVGRMIVSTRYSATSEYRLWVCTQTGTSTYGWKSTTLA